MSSTARHLSCGLLLILVSIVSGCTAGPRATRPAHDPLLGGPPIPKRTDQPRAAAPAPTPAPVPAARLGTVELATNSQRSISPEYQLAIPAPESRDIQPIQQTSWNGQNRQDLQAKLKSMGVEWQDSKLENGQYHYRCTVPSPTDPNKSRQYEATASSQEEAMQAVLQRIQLERNADRR